MLKLVMLKVLYRISVAEHYFRFDAESKENLERKTYEKLQNKTFTNDE